MPIVYSIRDNDLIWFQYRVIFRIMGTNHYFYKINLTKNPFCSFCGKTFETMLHLFVKCKKTIVFCKNVRTWLQRSINFDISLDPWNILFG